MKKSKLACLQAGMAWLNALPDELVSYAYNPAGPPVVNNDCSYNSKCGVQVLMTHHI
jgi:hypothetical protein